MKNWKLASWRVVEQALFSKEVSGLFSIQPPPILEVFITILR